MREALRAAGGAFSAAGAPAPPLQACLHTALPHIRLRLVLEIMSMGKTSFPDVRDAASTQCSLKSHQPIQKFLTPFSSLPLTVRP